MIELLLPEPWMWALRWALLLCPLAALLILIRWRPPSHRRQVAGLFAFLYGASMVFVTHALALRMGWWSYGWDALMLEGIPADILIGGAILFGPVLYYAFPRTGPFLLFLPIVIGAHGMVFSSLRPLVEAGPGWFSGVVFVFLTAHAPAVYLARWTEADAHSPWRAALLALMFAGLAFGILPALIMRAMGGDWALAEKSPAAWAGLACGLAFSFAMGLAAVQSLALQGRGTAIPLDPTKRLVRTGIYAFICNPMQLSAALSWIFIGIFLKNFWVASAALMAWIFVQGMVRWHHRHDLLERYPEDWPEYRRHVPEWLPRWRPWTPQTSVLTLNPERRLDAAFRRALNWLKPVGLEIRMAPGPARYANPWDVRSYAGFPALCAALTHGDLLSALAGHVLLTPALCWAALFAGRRAHDAA